jgi:hypothetical protein
VTARTLSDIRAVWILSPSIVQSASSPFGGLPSGLRQWPALPETGPIPPISLPLSSSPWRRGQPDPFGFAMHFTVRRARFHRENTAFHRANTGKRRVSAGGIALPQVARSGPMVHWITNRSGRHGTVQNWDPRDATGQAYKSANRGSTRVHRARGIRVPAAARSFRGGAASRRLGRRHQLRHGVLQAHRPLLLPDAEARAAVGTGVGNAAMSRRMRRVRAGGTVRLGLIPAGRAAVRGLCRRGQPVADPQSWRPRAKLAGCFALATSAAFFSPLTVLALLAGLRSNSI